MDDLFNKAIVLIYPDGFVEEIPIGTESVHSLVLKEHAKHSTRFRELCGNLNFDVGIHMHIDLVLLQNGVIAIYNYNLKDIINDPSIIYSCPPQFKVFLGTKFYSDEQREKYEKLDAMYGTLFFRYYYDAEKQDFLPETLLRDDEGARLL